MSQEIRVFVGFDPKEAVAYSVFCHSVLARTKAQVSFTPITGKQRDASNVFAYQRFCIPWMCGFKGRAIWADGDMLCRGDIAELWEMSELGCDVSVVKHEYSTKHPIKFLGQQNHDYPRKNWSSLMLFECGNYPWRKITPEYVERAKGSHLHRFEFLKDERIGDLPKEWNHLVGEQDYNPDAKIAHFTIGTPCWRKYADWDYADEWRREYEAMTHFEPWVDTFDDTPMVSER